MEHLKGQVNDNYAYLDLQIASKSKADDIR